MVPQRYSCVCLLMVGITAVAIADEADVTDVSVNCDASRSCSFNVTVRHADTGWEHYADHWRVLDPNGNELGRRVLYHPHVDEQPFTRSLNSVMIPEGIDKVTLEAHDNTHQYGGETITVEVP